MRTVLSASLIAFALLGAPTLGLAAEPGEASAETNTVPDNNPAHPPPTDRAAEDEAETSQGIMQNFTRHRPGACPEGPPCKVED